jgi:hypothetical protein
MIVELVLNVGAASNPKSVNPTSSQNSAGLNPLYYRDKRTPLSFKSVHSRTVNVRRRTGTHGSAWVYETSWRGAGNVHLKRTGGNTRKNRFIFPAVGAKWYIPYGSPKYTS